jgi:hypothetical protein
MYNQPDIVGLALIAAMAVTAAVWILWEARHSNRLRSNAIPMSPRIRHLLMWVAFIEVAVMTLWETQHGRAFYP